MTKYLILLTLLVSSVLVAAPLYNVGTIEQRIVVNDYWRIVSPEKITTNNIATLDKSAWKQVKNKAILVDNNPKGNWFIIELFNNTTSDKWLYFTLDNNPFITDAQLYTQKNKAAVSDASLILQNNNLRISHLYVPDNSTLRLYLFVVSEENITLNIDLYDEASFIDLTGNKHFNSGLAIGGIIFLALVELLWFFATGLKSALLLTGYFIIRAMLLALLLGWNLYYLLPQMPELRGVALPLLAALASIFFLWFILELFNVKHEDRKLACFIRYFCWLILLYMPLSLLFSVAQNITISIIIYILTIMLLVIIAYFLIKRKNRLGGLLAFISLLEFIFMVIIIVSTIWFGVSFVEYHDILFYAAFWLNGLLISFLLSRQYFFEVQDKEIAQRLAVENAISSEKAQKELYNLQQENQEILEQHVQERTLELNIALQELEAANQELARKNTIDELTGLNNRRFYDQKILAEFRRSKRNLTPLSLVLIDIDHFKKVNDTYGHQAGDLCLQQLAKIIKENLKRSTDIGCRYGGEEFCLIIPDTDMLGAIELAEKLRQKVSISNFEFEQQSINITISCGVATYTQEDNASPEKLFAAADKALYKAKINGRNQTWQFSLKDL
jgi:diguanylate cyclase (GGDEF)-like protein